MSSRTTRETGGGVLSFTFLDVLTCTMGSLVLLVVILGQKAAHTRLEDALRNGPRKSTVMTSSPAPAANGTPFIEAGGGDVTTKLAKLREQEAKLAEIRAKATERIGEQKARVGHLEEHERRLEHELAQLHIALERLADAEKKQSVDQESAERDLERLKQLLVDTEERLETLRSEPGGQRSFAIVPYKGANGTYRRPIYIECTKDAVTIQPEGILLTAIDFDGPLHTGNPLVAAVRAAREELNARAAAAGGTDMADPYPLLIVRPNGSRAYAAALSAISAWDADYGYEFVDADWKLEYPDPDPRLGQAMVHAVDQARSRQAMLAKIAPRRYGNRLTSASRGPGGSGGTQRHGSGSLDTMAESSGDDQSGGRGDSSMIATNIESLGDGAFSGTSSASGGSRGVGSGSSLGVAGGVLGGTFADQFSPPSGSDSTNAGSSDSESSEKTPNSLAADAGKNESGATGGPANSSQMSSCGPAGSEAGAGSEGGAGGVPGGPSASGSTSPSSMASAGVAGSASAAGGAMSPSGGGSASGQAGGVVSANAAPDVHSAAETRGANWANAAASRPASPITRPIQVVVRPDQLDVLPTREDSGMRTADPTVVSFHQPGEIVKIHDAEWAVCSGRPTAKTTNANRSDKSSRDLTSRRCSGTR